LAGHKEPLGWALAAKRILIGVSVVSCGIILANLLVSSDSTLTDFVPLPVTTGWLYAAAFLCGLVLAMALDSGKWTFLAIGLSALVAVLVFSGVLMSAVLLNRAAPLDLALFVAFQQSFPRFILICLLGLVGVSAAHLVEAISERLGS